LLQKNLKTAPGAFNTTKAAKTATYVGFLQNASTALYLSLFLIGKSNTAK